MDNKPKRKIISYISTGLSNIEKDYPLLQDMQIMVKKNPAMTAEQLLSEVAMLIEEDKAIRMAREAKRHSPEDDDEWISDTDPDLGN